MSTYYGEHGEKHRLADKPLGKPGGEGTAYDIVGGKHAGKVAKIYHDPTPDRQAKVKAQVSLGAPIANCAWPLDVLYSDPARKHFAGFVMKKCKSHLNIADVYAFPPQHNVSMQEKLQVLISLCEATERLHSKGQVVGDYNNNNILIEKGHQVFLIDCDSFDVRTATHHFPCGVCLPGFAAPEAIRAQRGYATYSDAARAGKTVFTKRTDDFALAVNIFRTIFNGANPYAGVPATLSSGSPAAAQGIDKNVEKGETPYFGKAAGYKAPWYAPELAAFPSYLTNAFRRAFVDAHRAPEKRPTAAQWKGILNRYLLELRTCSSNPAHKFHKDTKACPYCAALARDPEKLERERVAAEQARIQAQQAAAAKKQREAAALAQQKEEEKKRQQTIRTAAAIVGGLFISVALALIANNLDFVTAALDAQSYYLKGFPAIFSLPLPDKLLMLSLFAVAPTALYFICGGRSFSGAVALAFGGLAALLVPGGIITLFSENDIAKIFMALLAWPYLGLHYYIVAYTGFKFYSDWMQ